MWTRDAECEEVIAERWLGFDPCLEFWKNYEDDLKHSNDGPQERSAQSETINSYKSTGS